MMIIIIIIIKKRKKNIYIYINNQRGKIAVDILNLFIQLS